MTGPSGSPKPSRWLDHRQFSHTYDPTAAVIERSQEGFTSGTTHVPENRDISVLRTPTFVLTSPDLDTLMKAMPEVLDASPLITYGDELFSRLGQKRVGKTSLVSHLSAAVSGCDQRFDRDQRIGPGRIELVKAHVLITSTRDQLSDALAADVFSAILRRSLLLDIQGSPDEVPAENIRYGYSTYYHAIKEVLDARRRGTGLRLAVKPEVASALHDLTGELHDWWEAVPGRLQPFFADILSLPYRLHWAFLATLASRESDQWVLPFTISTTRELLERQMHLLEELITSGEVDEHHRARVIMLKKLSDGPCLFRSLLRRYSNQRRDVHEPVLNELVQDGLIHLRDDGYLELSEAGRAA